MVTCSPLKFFLLLGAVILIQPSIAAGDGAPEKSADIVRMQEESNEQIKMAPIPILGPSAVDNLSTKLGTTFFPAFISSLALIILSELGDKTFFIAALLSMKKGPTVVFSGAISALIIMTLLSCGAGVALPALLSRKYTHIASIVLFVVFGVKLIYEGIQMEPDSGAEGLAEVEIELSKKKIDVPSVPSETASLRKVEAGMGDVPDWSESTNPSSANIPQNGSKETFATSCSPTSPVVPSEGQEQPSEPSYELKGVYVHKTSIEEPTPQQVPTKSQKDAQSPGRFAFIRPVIMMIVYTISLFQMKCGVFIPSAFVEAFTLTFTAEWGDRSQISTVALAASKNIWGVNLGAILGHAFCTTLAVIGGKLLASRISEKAVTLCGGCTFLLFSVLGVLYNI